MSKRKSQPKAESPHRPLFNKPVFQVISIKGAMERFDGADWKAADAEAFMCKFFAFLEAEGVGFGGAFWEDGEPKATPTAVSAPASSLCDCLNCDCSSVIECQANNCPCCEH